MAVCLLASALGVTAFADDPQVIRVSGLKRGGNNELETIGSFSSFEDGWSEAVKTAEDSDKMNEGNYERIVVDLLADWKATNGEFGSGTGFSSNAICFPGKAPLTLNLNGYTIDRDLTEWKWNGEVIYIGTKADAIINNGTITGGWSGGGAGGIHIDDKARVVLNDVHIVGNIADDDDGGGIAVYDGAVLIMNKGSLKYNCVRADTDYVGVNYYGISVNGLGGAIYAEDSEIMLSEVDIINNQTRSEHHLGAAIYARSSKVTLDSCRIEENGISGDEKDTSDEENVFLDEEEVILDEDSDSPYKEERLTGDENKIYTAYSVLSGYKTNFIIKNTNFSKNGAYLEKKKTFGEKKTIYSTLIYLDQSNLVFEGGKFENNASAYLIETLDSSINATGTQFINNDSDMMHGTIEPDSFFKNCKFNNNIGIYSAWEGIPTFGTLSNKVNFYDCDMGNSTYANKNVINIVDDGTGSLLGQGNISMILSLLAFFIACAAMGIVIVKKQKKQEALVSIVNEGNTK